MLTYEQLSKTYPSIFKMGDDGILEIYCDHHMLSTLRLCPAKAYEEFFSFAGHNLGTKQQRYFSLEFGTWLHEVLNNYYKHFKAESCAPPLDDWLKQSYKLWQEFDLDFFKPSSEILVKDLRGDQKKYYNFAKREPESHIHAFLVHYYAFYMNQRMRVVSTEVSFGRKKEVPLGEFRNPRLKYWEGPEGESDLIIESWDPIRCYLTGRIDLVVDNGYKIGPVDHKHTARFDGYESEDFDPHDGITGYIFTIDSILQNLFPENPYKICRGGWIFHISAAEDNPRFKPTPISKTTQQLEDFRKRQLLSFERIYKLAIIGKLESYGQIEFNTMICNNIYNSPCQFKELHKQPFEQREGTINQFYQIKPAWNPAEYKDDRRVKNGEGLVRQ